MKFETYKDKKNLWRWRLKSRNGKIIAHGESYKIRCDMIRIIEKIYSMWHRTDYLKIKEVKSAKR